MYTNFDPQQHNGTCVIDGSVGEGETCHFSSADDDDNIKENIK
jgi:hypothetical protein